jgi:RNA recognition motif-containing protein
MVVVFLTASAGNIPFKEKEDMETKLFVGNLSYTTTGEDLRALFTQAGAVTSVDLIMDRETGRSKGFAFIEMGSQSDVENSIRLFNGYTLGNREIKVSIAKPREERPRGGGWYNDRPGGDSKRRPSDRGSQRRSNTRRY